MITQSSIMDKLKVKPIAEKIANIDLIIKGQKEDIDLNILIEDKRHDYEDISYEKMLNNLKNTPVTRDDSNKDISQMTTNVFQTRDNNNIKYKFIRKVENIQIKIGNIKIVKVSKEFKDTINVIIEGELINNKKLPKQSRQNAVQKIASNYYLNNRETFIQFINAFMNQYKEALEKNEELVTCETTEPTEFKLLLHQKIVRDYLNLYTPYRGLLLYHGLGSGKTCSSIAIAEGLKSNKNVIVLTPKSLLRNYIEELKACGDPLYKHNYYWTFVDVYGTTEHDKIGKKQDLINQLVNELDLSETYILQKKGAWVPDASRKPNFQKLDIAQQNAILDQINTMIHAKYHFVSYNGLRKDNIHHKLFTFNGTKNPFDNKIVIVDEAHNFVSRIVNKLSIKAEDNTPSILLYNWLLNAYNCRIILLSGTPIINYPNELAVLFNILRGHMNEFIIKVDPKTSDKVDTKFFKDIFNKFIIFNDSNKKNTVTLLDILDVMDYKASTRILSLMRNPEKFINLYKKNQYSGVKYYENLEIPEKHFKDAIVQCLSENKIGIVNKHIEIIKHKVFDENKDVFMNKFVDIPNRSLQNPNLFKRRIIGLTSYFKSAQEQLMPKYNKNTDLHTIRIPMSKHQLGIYEAARVKERKEEQSLAKKKKKGNIYDETSSTYRIYSRSACNFVFPDDITKPIPKAPPKQNELNDEDDDNELQDKEYAEKIRETLQMFKSNSSKYFSPLGLETYSPKFASILKNILDPENIGNHLIYSDFKTLEGIGLFKLVLLENGFVEFKINKTRNGVWSISMDDNDIGKKPAFVSYTGDEDDDVKEIYRNIFNNLWHNVPVTISKKLYEHAQNNIYGDIIKIFMITASGAEGISLKNGRFVHIMESYWHPVRKEQVIGRIRRICSHEELPENQRMIKVFMYLMTFSDEQRKNQLSTELMLKDKSQLDKNLVITTDEYMFEKSNIKEEINNTFIQTIKEASIDCNLYKSNKNDDKYTCYTFNNPNVNKYLYAPSILQEEDDLTRIDNVETKTLNARKVELDGQIFAMTDDYVLYDYSSFISALNHPGETPIMIGTLDIKNKTIIKV